jgi:hypothetical protein
MMENEEGRGIRTSLYSILCIAIRLGAVMIALRVFGAAFGFFGSGQPAQFSAGEGALAVAWLLFMLLISVLLWLYPGPLARLASARSAQQVFESPISAGQIQWIALSVLGMSWVMYALLDLAHMGYQYFWLQEWLGTGEQAERLMRGQVSYHVCELVLGLSLTLGSRGLAGILQKIRFAGSGMDGQGPGT